MIYLGIDPQLSPAIAVMKGDQIRFKVLKPLTLAQWMAPGRVSLRPRPIPKWYYENLRTEDIGVRVLHCVNGLKANKEDLVIGLESLSYGEKYRVALMAQIEWVILSVLTICTFEYRIIKVAPSTWKKRVGGNGRMSKAAVAEVLRKRFPHLPKISKKDESHCMDALAILLAAREMYHERQ